jgi:hypothetical protein
VQVSDSINVRNKKKHVYFLFHSRIIGPKVLWFYLLMCASRYQALDKQLGVWDTTGTATLHYTPKSQIFVQQVQKQDL